MPRAEKMNGHQTNGNARKVFYWEDTGAVETVVENGFIVQAIPVEGPLDVLDHWKAESSD